MSNELVLIADAQMGRARRIAAALEVTDRACRLVEPERDLLEAVLAESPTVVVVQVAIGRVDPPRFCEILRSNPATRSVRILFLGADSADTARIASLGGECLPADAEADAVQAVVEVLLARGARLAAFESRAKDEGPLHGSLEEVDLAELLESLSLRRATGRVTLAADGSDGLTRSGWVLVNEGEVHSAGTGPVLAEKALFRMLDWGSGKFRFETAKLDQSATITAPTRSVLSEGLRQRDEWNRLAPKLPPLEAPVELSVDHRGLPETVHPLTQEVIALLGELDRVGDVVDRCQYPDYQVLRALHALAERGVVTIGRARIAPLDSAVEPALFNPTQVRRLRGFVTHAPGREPDPPSAKLLVVGGNPGATELFSALLRKAPGVRFDPRFVRRPVEAGDLETIARVDVDGQFSLDLVHLPTPPEFQALWRFAVHGALGTLFLFDAESESSPESVEALSAGLGEGAEARLLNVVMLGEGERFSPEDLRENLPLIDEASLFLLPVEAGKDPSSLLRSLFARVVP